MSLTVTPSGGGGITASSTNTLTNKSIDANTNTLTNLSATSVKDGSDPTKTLNFDVSAISTATTRTLAYPNSNTTLPIASQVLTISGPTAARTVTLPDASFTAARTDAANTFTGTQTFGAIANSDTQTSAAGTIAANTPARTVTQTWNNAAVNFVVDQITITDTASTGTASGFVNYKVGSTHMFGVGKNGVVTAGTGFGIGAGVGIASGLYLTASRFYHTSVSGDVLIGSPGLSNSVTLDGAVNKVNTPFTLKGYTVATLPAGTVGMTAYVTDALAPAFLATVVGGGAVVTPVFYNGSAWVSQ